MDGFRLIVFYYSVHTLIEYLATFWCGSWVVYVIFHLGLQKSHSTWYACVILHVMLKYKVYLCRITLTLLLGCRCKVSKTNWSSRRDYQAEVFCPCADRGQLLPWCLALCGVSRHLLLVCHFSCTWVLAQCGCSATVSTMLFSQTRQPTL